MMYDPKTAKGKWLTQRRPRDLQRYVHENPKWTKEQNVRSKRHDCVTVVWYPERVW